MRKSLWLVLPAIACFLASPVQAQNRPSSDPWIKAMESARGLSVGDLSPKYGDRKKPSPRSGSDTRPDSRDSGPPRVSGQRAGSTLQPGQDGEPSSSLMSELIKTWLTVAEPPENATRGAHLQYTMRGNVVGTVPGGIITSRHETGGFDPVYLWSERRKLDSVNHCTMEEFVNACVQNKSIAHCQGRYKPVPPPPLDDFKGMKASAARTAVQGKGLVPIVRESEPAPERGLERRVISQHPKPKTLLKRGETVELAVYGPYKALIAISGVKGKSAAEARQILASSGLNTAFEPGDPAPNTDSDNLVQRTDPPEGERVQKGTTVIVKLYTPHVSPGVILPDFTGQSLSEARKWLASNKLQASLQPGSPAPTAQKSGTIEKQGIAPGTKMAQGETITLTVHSGFVELRKVPDVVGLSAGEAKRRMSAIGLNTSMKAGGAPSSQEKAGTVERQSPDPGTAVATGVEVSLFIQGPFVETIAVPDVSGLSYPDSKRKLEAAGLTIYRRDAGKPAERRFAETAQRQEPAVGTRVSKGSAVAVWVFGQYIPNREEQVAAMDCSWLPGSRAYWDNNAGKPLCGCFDGLQWNLTNTRCVTASVRENELCAREGQGLVAQGRTTQGKINCVCPEGLTWNASQRACEKLIAPEELCSRNYPGSVPTGRDANGNVNCGCPQGYAWNAARTACQKLPQSQEISPQEYCSRNFPGSVPDGNDAAGRVNCDCPQGYVWSADGQRCVKSEGPAIASGAGLICFTRREGTSSPLMVISPDGRNLRKIAENARDPALSYDGKWIAYKSTVMNQAPIEICRVDGSQRWRIGTDGANYNRPKWTADGRKLFFAYAPPGNDPDWRLGWMNLDGSGLGQTPFNGHTYLPAPDGRRAVFVNWSNAGQGLFVVNVGAPLKTGRQITYSQYPVEDHGASWSPDSSTIAFIRTGNKGVNSLCTIPAQGGSVRVIVSNTRCGLRTAWSPDGKQIMIIQKIAGGSGREEGQLAFVSVVDGTIRQFTDAAIGVMDVDWR